MSEKQKPDLGNVQKTLFLPLWGRAVESKKDKPWLVDETPVRIIDQVDYDFSKLATNMDDLTKIAWMKNPTWSGAWKTKGISWPGMTGST